MGLNGSFVDLLWRLPSFPIVPELVSVLVFEVDDDIPRVPPEGDDDVDGRGRRKMRRSDVDGDENTYEADDDELDRFLAQEGFDLDFGKREEESDWHAHPRLEVGPGDRDNGDERCGVGDR